MNVKTALAVTMTLSLLTRLIIAGILITASYELDTYILRLGFVCSGLWLGIMAIRKTIFLRRALKEITKTE
jgi:hypothetical protein